MFDKIIVHQVTRPKFLCLVNLPFERSQIVHCLVGTSFSNNQRHLLLPLLFNFFLEWSCLHCLAEPDSLHSSVSSSAGHENFQSNVLSRLSGKIFSKPLSKIRSFLISNLWENCQAWSGSPLRSLVHFKQSGSRNVAAAVIVITVNFTAAPNVVYCKDSPTFAPTDDESPISRLLCAPLMYVKAGFCWRLFCLSVWKECRGLDACSSNFDLHLRERGGETD